MAKAQGWLNDGAYLLLRVMAGFAFAQHGAQLVFGLLGGHAVPLASQAGLAGVIELAAGLLIGFGVFTSCAAFIASGVMAVAYFQVHARQGFWPIQNHGELAVLYCFIFLFLAASGGGRWKFVGR
jgi:putative oxidoreductase